jgi:hypothetical protein
LHPRPPSCCVTASATADQGLHPLPDLLVGGGSWLTGAGCQNVIGGLDQDHRTGWGKIQAQQPGIAQDGRLVVNQAMLEIHLGHQVRPWTLTLLKRMQHLLWLGERPGSSASLLQVRAGVLRRNLLDEVSHGFLLT